MVKVRNIFGDVYSGKVGKAGVFATWKGRQYRRSWVKPANPKTPAQQAVRNNFKNAVAEWQGFSIYQKTAYNNLATPYQISGFNLWVSRYQKAAASGGTLPSEPLEGIKQIGSAYESKSDPTVAAAEQTLTGPIQIGSVSFSPGSTGVDLKAIVYLDRGMVVFPDAISGTVTIDYEAGGRKITGEVLAENPTAGSKAFTKYWPLNYKSVHVYVDGTEVDALEVYAASGKAYFTKTAPGDTSGTIDYVSYTPIANAKLEVYKAGTNTLVWRGYSDPDGFLPLAATSEDEPYDLMITAAGYTAVSRVSQTAADVTKEELIIMT